MPRQMRLGKMRIRGSACSSDDMRKPPRPKTPSTATAEVTALLFAIRPLA